METYPDALYNAVVTDLSRILHTIPGPLLFGDDEINHWPGISVREAAALSLRNSILKKYEYQTEKADDVAYNKFIFCNQRCSEWKLPKLMEVDSLVIDTIIHKFYTMLDGVSSFAPSLSKISKGFGFGNGASLGATGCSFYEKAFGGHMTVTRSSLYLAMLDALDGDRWISAELSRFIEFGPPKLVNSSNLSIVPKNRKSSRVICTEPSVNMMFQKGLSSCFSDVLKHFYNIDMSTQPEKNKSLAQRGSISNNIATIDLSSASDLISLNLCKALLPSDLLNWMLLVRTPNYFCESRSKDIEPLHMISTMGNGFTSTFQTLLFATIIDSVYSVMSIRRTPDNFGVFGDDMICSSKAYPMVCRVLELLGLSVNHDKSFNDGYFRESCGGDFYKGTDIRGVFCRTLKTTQDVNSLINRLVRWSANHDIWLCETIDHLLTKVRSRNKFFVPPYEDDTAGLHVPMSVLPIYQRFNKGFTFCYTKFEPRLRFYDVAATCFLDRKQNRNFKVEGKPVRLFYSPDGVLVSAVAGSLRDGRLGLASRDAAAFSVRRRVVPCWDFVPLALGRFGPGGLERWFAFSFGYFWSPNSH